jgi:phage/plasmid primase-like uncharacterized protein
MKLAPLYYKNHLDVIHDFYSDIQSAFTEAGGIAPNLSEICPSSTWRYCKTSNRKHKGKVGYICQFDHTADTPRVRITIHSFAQGGSTVTFDSHRIKYQQTHPAQNAKIIQTKRPNRIQIKQAEQRANREAIRKKHLFEHYLSQWQQASPFIGDHPYVIKKQLKDCTAFITNDSAISNNENTSYPTHAQLKISAKNQLLLPIYNLNNTLCAIQSILPSGRKFIFGKKKEGFIPIGDIQQAKKIYLCEGYATANALFQIILLSQKRKTAFCVIAALDNKNMEIVAKHFKETFKNKKIIVCPDNDAKKISTHRGNPGLLSGYNCTIQSYCEIIILPSHATQGSDWNDYWLENPEHAMTAFLNQEKKTRLDYAIDRLSCFALKESSISLKKACFAALKIASFHYPTKIDEKIILDRVSQATHYTGLSEKDIAQFWYKIKKSLFAQALRAKSITREQPEQVTRIEVDNLGEASQTIQTLKQQHPKAIFITNAPMGVGKTKDFIQPEFLLADMNNQLPVIITPNRALTKGVSERFNASHYIDDKIAVKQGAYMELPSALAITINSIISEKYQLYLSLSKTIFIDEYTQVLRAITSGTVEATKRHQTEKRLAALITQSHYTYIADADFNQIALNQLLAITTQHPIFFFILKKDTQTSQNTDTEQPSNTDGHIQYRFYRDKDEHFTSKYIIHHILEAAQSGQKLYIASDSKKQLDCLQTALQELAIQTLVINADTVNLTQQKQFLDNPNLYLKTHQPQIVLVSPAIQSGVSIEVDYFERCFGIYQGKVTPSVFQQMLHRVRPQRIFELSLPPTLATERAGQASESAIAILVDAYQQHIQQFGGAEQIQYRYQDNQHYIGPVNVSEQNGQIILSGDEDYARYEILCAQTQALDNQQRHHCASFFLIQAIARGVDIQAISIKELSKNQKSTFKEIFKHLSEKTKEQYIQRIIQAESITDTQYQYLKYQGGNHEKQIYQMLRYDIITTLNRTQETLNEADIHYYLNNGLTYIANYHALNQGIEQAQRNDANDKQMGVAKTNAKWRKTKVTLLNLIFATLQIDIESGEGCYTQNQAQQTRLMIKQDENIVRYLTHKLKLNAKSQLSDTSFINKIIKKLLGLRVTRRLIREGELRFWNYEIDCNDMSVLKTYHKLKYHQLV